MRNTARNNKVFKARFSISKNQASYFFSSCPWGTMIFTIAFMAIGYALVVNWENGMYLEYTKMQRNIATLKAEQNNFRLNIAKRQVLDPEIIEMTWDESKRKSIENIVVDAKPIKNVISSR